jgi:hypothetical protein
MIAVVETMTCSDCHEVSDVLIGRSGEEGPTGDPEYDKDLGKCAQCEGTNVVPWVEPFPCPKCDAAMAMGHSTAIWD